MHVTEIARSDHGRRTLVVVLDEGDEFVASVLAVARVEGVDAASLTAIGAFRDVTLGYYRFDAGTYDEIEVAEQVEVASLIGNLARGSDGQPALHAHGVVGRSDGSALGGHILRAEVRPTLEIVVEESPAHLVRRHRPELGLALIDLPASVGGPTPASGAGPSSATDPGHGPDLGL